MTQRNEDPLTGPGTTSDPNQADRTGLPGRKKFTKVPEEPKGPPQRNDHPASGPGTTDDPNMSTKVDLN
jgi:hypothetical protein